MSKMIKALVVILSAWVVYFGQYDAVYPSINGLAFGPQIVNAQGDVEIMDAYPAWSPKGDLIAFTSNRAGNLDIWVIDVNTRRMTNLTSGYTDDDNFPIWSPDGNHIAFLSKRESDSGHFDIWMMEPDGSNPVNLTASLSLGAIRQPAWSPDGHFIAFTGYEEHSYGSIWMIDLIDLAATNLTPENDLHFEMPTWSPDSKRIAFLAGDSNTFEGRGIWMIAIDTGELTPLNAQIDARNLFWSPTADVIAATIMTDLGLKIVLLDVAHPEKPIETQAGAETSLTAPFWSPDGSTICYFSTADGNSDIWVMQADGTNPINLTPSKDSIDWVPAWSPDSRRIAFMSSQDNQTYLWMVNVDGTGLVNLTGLLDN